MNIVSGLYLLLAAVWFTLSLVLQLAFSEAYQASMWMLFLTLISCSLAYTSAVPRLQRNTIVAIVGVSFVICTIIAACAFAAGLATKTIDPIAFGFGLFITLVGIPLTGLWTKRAFAKTPSQDLVLKTDERVVSLVQSDEPALRDHSRPGCCDSKCCTYCANFWWILLGILIVIFTAEVIGEVSDTRMLLPPDFQLVTVEANSSQTFNSALTNTTGRDNPRLTKTHDRHFVCNGTGSPLVILEHGMGGSVWDWAWVQQIISRSPNGTKVCAFSRPGYGFSSRSSRPRSAAQTSLELKSVLHSEGLDVPFIHVGHSWGGFAMRMYVTMYPSQILAQVFVDAVHVPCMPQCDDKPFPSEIYRFVAALTGAGLARALAVTESLPVNGSALIALLPQDAQSPRLATIDAPQYWQTWKDEAEELSLSCDQVNRLAISNITTFKVPIRNIMAAEGIHLEADGNYTCGTTLENLSFPPGTSVIIPRAPHIELLFDKQFAPSVASNILDVIQQVRAAM